MTHSAFHYDRSLEYFLLTSLKASYGLGDRKAFDLLRAIEIIPVQGQVGRLALSHMPGDARSYEADLEKTKLKTAIAGIEVVHEQETLGLPSKFAQAQAILREADVICFLGFGYLEANLQRLGIQTIANKPDRRKLPNLFGSAFHLPKSDAQRVATYLYTNIELGPTTKIA